MNKRIADLVCAYWFAYGAFWLGNGKYLSSRPQYIWKKYIYPYTTWHYPGDYDDYVDKEVERRDRKLEALRKDCYFRSYGDE